MKEINSNVAIKRSKSFQLLPNLNKNANKNNEIHNEVKLG